MTTASTCRAKSSPPTGARFCQRLLACPCLALAVLVLAGCASSPWSVTRKHAEKADAPPQENFLLASMRVLYDPGPEPDQVQAEMDAALELFAKKDYSEAQKKFRRIGHGKHTPARVAEKALFYEAECSRAEKYLPNAAQIYTEVVQKFPRGAHHYDCLSRMFEIADYWLDETRDELRARAEQKENKRLFVMPVSFVHIDRTKPLFDLEGHALSLLEKVYLYDRDGELGEKALFLLGSVNFHRQNFRDADFYFHELVRHHPNSKSAPKALELSIICKQMTPGGPEYDGRSLAEARELVHQAMTAYPELASQKHEFLQRRLTDINLQQAAQDMNIADYYRRVGRPGSAYLYYELVCRCYPGTPHAAEAARKKAEVYEQARRQQERRPFWQIWPLWPNSGRTSSDDAQPGGNGPPPHAPTQPGGAEVAPMPRPVNPGPGDTGLQQIGLPK